jgi:hypothetical protein
MGSLYVWQMVNGDTKYWLLESRLQMCCLLMGGGT